MLQSELPLFANHSKINGTLATYFSSWAKANKLIELYQSAEFQRKAAQCCAGLKKTKPMI